MKISSIIDLNSNNKKISLVLIPEDQMEQDLLKRLNGGKVQLIANGVSLLANSITNGLLISDDATTTLDLNEKKSSSGTTKNNSDTNIG